MAERNSLLNCRTGNGTAGSNPALSAEPVLEQSRTGFFISGKKPGEDDYALKSWSLVENCLQTPKVLNPISLASKLKLLKGNSIDMCLRISVLTLSDAALIAY